MKKIVLLIMLCATGFVSAAENAEGRVMFGKYNTIDWADEMTRQVQEIMKKTSYSAKATAPSRKPKSSARKTRVSRRKEERGNFDLLIEDANVVSRERITIKNLLDTHREKIAIQDLLN
jgi:hypothetical protein